MEMRSDLIHEALRTVSNRYTLCQLASKATRNGPIGVARVSRTGVMGWLSAAT